ncbi:MULTISPECIES: DeoR/GlpR family DNA-binding transcription regulator [Clostridium]|uniref:DeoR/GlpR family DNA-binding transcription regulator n=1 Tax=Clostridium TaxID=1485 RepID=UPI0013FA3766|nr:MULTISPECIES: DeoR/GlpR family DNA-binding transcription regulator [Clostridium]MBY7024016.1 DeoR/GlpR transcriptional regulator [Clostridium botulinum]NFG57473.1 DeoR/GlpR transcriptional regulator [Clostridium botulinum]NFO45911.1 DeoR/GlpR transcriptional regulator [Clostridium botulinum]
MINRHTKLLELVNSNERIQVSRLSEYLDVSQVTIRKDLKVLEEKGLLRREHGYAIINSSDDINNRLSINYDIKRKIAQLASDLVSNGETIMIESGSCCALLADEIARNKKDVTIITNSAFIASYIREVPFINIILLGGDYQHESQVLVGPITKKCAQEFFVDKLFVGTDGFSIDSGFSGINHLRTETVKTMAECANNLIILTESSKLSKRGTVAQFKANEVDYLLTDNNISDNIKNELLKNNVTIKTISIN